MKQALLIIDVQNDYFQNGKMELHQPEKALQQINQLETFFNEKQMPIIYIQHIKEQTNANFFEKGTTGALLHEKLHVNVSSIIIEKHYPDSFLKTDLHNILKSLNIEQLVITGMMTHMCIDSTTRKSCELGYRPILISDATSTKSLTFQAVEVSAQDVQNAFLAALQNFAQIITTKQFLN